MLQTAQAKLTRKATLCQKSDIFIPGTCDTFPELADRIQDFLGLPAAAPILERVEVSSTLLSRASLLYLSHAILG